MSQEYLGGELHLVAGNNPKTPIMNLDAGEVQPTNARLIAAAPEMYRLIKLSLQAGRFPEVGDGCEQWNPAEVARALLAKIEGP